MGVAGLLKILRELEPNIVHMIDLSDLAGGNLGIDVAILTFVYKSSYVSSVIDKLDCIFYDVDYEKASEHMIFEVLRFFYNVLKGKMTPVTVFDGKSPSLKDDTKGERIQRSANVKIKIDELRRIGQALLGAAAKGEVYNLNPEELAFLASFPKPITTIDDLKYRLKLLIKQHIVIVPAERQRIMDILRIMGLPVVQAPSEAEFCCAEMAKRKDITAVYSTDSDCLMYGTPIMINKLAYMGGAMIPKPPKAYCYTYDNALEVTGLTTTQFSEWCIMCGTDFNNNPPGIGPKQSLEMMKTFGSISKMKEIQQQLFIFMEQNPKAKLDKVCKALYKCDFTVLNLSEVKRFVTTPSRYDPEDLKINTDPNIPKEAASKLKKVLSEKYYLKFYPYLNKILDILYPEKYARPETPVSNEEKPQ
jgi:flap endonuclease-1